MTFAQLLKKVDAMLFTGGNVWPLIGSVLILLFAGLLGCDARASAYDDTPDMAAYYESLMQPDNDTGCCGPGDAYYADKVDACKPLELQYDPTCKFVAIITDDRPDLRIVGGKTIQRAHLEIGTRVIVPARKVRQHPIPNPTDHNVIFVNLMGDAICWEPVAGL